MTMVHFYCNISKCRSLLVAALTGVGMLTASAQSINIVSELTGEDGTAYDGIMSQTISPNHKYIAGTVTNIAEFKNGIFIYDMETGDYVIQGDVNPLGSKLFTVTDEGLAVGYNGDSPEGFSVTAQTMSIDGTTTKLETPEESNSYACGITDDGKILVGYYASTMDYVNHACIWKDGKLETLPTLTEEETGTSITGSEANFVSGDGSVIAGSLLDGDNTELFALWRLQDDGSYECELIGNKYYSRDGTDPERPYKQFQIAGLSHNGKYAALKLGVKELQHAARYDVEAGTFEECMHEESGELTDAGAIDAVSIADDGTLLGNCVTSAGWVNKPCIWKAGEKTPQLISTICPDLEQLAAFDATGFNFAMCITPDGRYVTGYSDDSNKQAAMMNMNTAYVIDLYGTTVGISNHVADGVVNGEEARYTIDGTRVNAPVKGLNIIKKADGSVVKLMVK